MGAALALAGIRHLGHRELHEPMSGSIRHWARARMIAAAEVAGRPATE
jgi:hypothetical protein